MTIMTPPNKTKTAIMTYFIAFFPKMRFTLLVSIPTLPSRMSAVIPWQPCLHEGFMER